MMRSPEKSNNKKTTSEYYTENLRKQTKRNINEKVFTLAASSKDNTVNNINQIEKLAGNQINV